MTGDAAQRNEWLQGRRGTDRSVDRRLAGWTSPALPEAAPMNDLLDCPDAPVSTVAEAPARRRGGGPRTPEGKERSRRNALSHGCRAEVLTPDDLADTVALRT